MTSPDATAAPARILARIEDSIAALTLVAITVIALSNVIARYFLDTALAFTTEITINLAVWMSMFGAVIAIRNGAHLGFSMLPDSLRGQRRRIVIALIGIVIATFLLVLLGFGLRNVLSQLESGRATPALGIPQWLFTAAIPVGAALGIFRIVQATRESVRKEPDAPAAGRVAP